MEMFSSPSVYVKLAFQEEIAGKYDNALALYMKAVASYITQLEYGWNVIVDKQAFFENLARHQLREQEALALLTAKRSCGASDEDEGTNRPKKKTRNGDSKHDKFRAGCNSSITKEERNAKWKEHIDEDVTEEDILMTIDGVEVTIRSNKRARDWESDDQAKLKAALSLGIVIEKPNVKWNDVVCDGSAKEALREAATLPAEYPQFFSGKRRPTKTFFLHGPAGTGKSYIAKAVATEKNSTLFGVSSFDLVSRSIGESKKVISTLFQIARDTAPSVIFIDEIDSLRGHVKGEFAIKASRRIIKREILAQMQDVAKNDHKVLVIAATNDPAYTLDQEIKASFDSQIRIPLPDEHGRQQLFKVLLGDTPHNLTDSDFVHLARNTEDFSCSGISFCVKDALFEPLRKTRDATFFMKTDKDLWTPCGSEQSGVVQTTLKDLAAQGLALKILLPLIEMTDFDKALATHRRI